MVTACAVHDREAPPARSYRRSEPHRRICSRSRSSALFPRTCFTCCLNPCHTSQQTLLIAITTTMSEYWKSTPKYWCKFCKLFVRDTTLEKKQHEATPKHQSSIQRSLRDLHRSTEREEREKQRAKDEVARLNGIVSGKPRQDGTGAGPSTFGKSNAVPAQANPNERKRQMEQLAAMGIAVPQEFRKDVAAGGEWTTVSETPIYHFKAEDDDSKLAATAYGVRKRKLDEDEVEAEAVVRKGWGTKLKSYPGGKTGQEEDWDALLSASAVRKKDVKSEPSSTGVKEEETDAEASVLKRSEPDHPASLKKEESAAEQPLAAIPDIDQPGAPVKQEDAAPDPPVIFKKRKGKR